MAINVLFIHGAGEGAYEEDGKLVASLRKSLGDGYHVIYPSMPSKDNPEYTIWKGQISKELAALSGPVILVGHSLGGSHLLRYLTEESLSNDIRGIFVVSTPFWGNQDWDVSEYKLRDDATLPTGMPVFFYHARDDETASFSDLAIYAAKFPQATLHEFETGGHQLNDDLSAVAADIRHLTP